MNSPWAIRRLTAVTPWRSRLSLNKLSGSNAADPGWPAFDESRPVRLFDAGGSIELDPHGDERAIWPAG